MKPGDIVRHKLAGIRLEIKRINGNIASCKRIDGPELAWFGSYEVWTAVCHIDNLEPINPQLRIFS